MLNFKHPTRTLMLAAALAAVGFTAGCSADSEVSTSSGAGSPASPTSVSETAFVEDEETLEQTEDEVAIIPATNNVIVGGQPTDDRILSTREDNETNSFLTTTTEAPAKPDTTTTVPTTAPSATTPTTEPAVEPEPDVPPPATTVAPEPPASDDDDKHSQDTTDVTFPGIVGNIPWDFRGTPGGVECDPFIQEVVPDGWTVQHIDDTGGIPYSYILDIYRGACLLLPENISDRIITNGNPVAVHWVEKNSNPGDYPSYVIFFCTETSFFGENTEVAQTGDSRLVVESHNSDGELLRISGEFSLPFFYSTDSYTQPWTQTGRQCA